MKKILISILATIITIGALWFLVTYMGMASFAFAWALNFLLMIWAVALIEALDSQLTSSYFDDKKWEHKGKIYEYIGINFFRKVLVWIGWEKLNKKANPIKNSNEALMRFYFQTKKSELGHAIIIPIVLGFNIFVAVNFSFSKSLWLLILNILLNLYPVLLQRYNRPRIQRAISLSKRKERQVMM